jgi:hypothetical protein
MCSRWRLHSSKVIEKVRQHFMFPQQTSKVRKKIGAIMLILGVFFGKRIIQNLKNSLLRICISIDYQK